MEVIADRANHKARLLINQVGAGLQLGSVLDRVPKLHQVIQVPLQFFSGASDARGACDDAHAAWHFELRDCFPKLVAFLPFDAPRYAAAARIVRHQDEIASSERDVGRKRRALVAAFVLVDLNNQLLALAQLLLNAAVAGFFAVLGVRPRACSHLEAVTRDLLEGQEAVAVGSVIDEARFQRRLDARDDGLIDIALALFLGCGLDVEVDELLTVDDGHAKLFRLSGVEQHAFHGLPRRNSPKAAGQRHAPQAQSLATRTTTRQACAMTASPVPTGDRRKRSSGLLARLA